jgi:hypothetical protein
MIEIDFEYIERRVGFFVGIPAIDPEALDARNIFRCWPVFSFFPTLEFAGSVNSDIFGLSWFDGASLLSTFPTC